MVTCGHVVGAWLGYMFSTVLGSLPLSSVPFYTIIIFLKRFPLT